MGRFLQIRVSAVTVSEDDIEKEFPSLRELVWEDPDVIPKKGVMELAQAVFDGVRAGLIPAEKRELLEEKSEEAEKLRFKIQDALNARDPKSADKLTYELEDCLEALEDIAENF